MAKLALQCWKCNHTFEYNLDLSNRPAILISCPLCGEKCYFDAERNRPPVIEVYRGGAASGSAAAPMVLKTTPPPEA
jgi:hypothetical protein